MNSFENVAEYIRSNWDTSVRCSVQSEGTVPVPIPHTVPSPAGRFNVLFYWDTYFTNVGLIKSDRIDLAQSNCDALLWWIDQLGFVPNSAFANDSTRSQPPVLSLMVQEVYEQTGDVEWLRNAYPRLEKEHTFWETKRTFPGGLSHYGHQADDAYLVHFHDSILHRRLKVSREAPESEKIQFASQMLAEAESGQDFTPIYGHKALDYADLELNCLLYSLEKNLAFFADSIGLPKGTSESWRTLADFRIRKVNTDLWDANAGLYRHLNFSTGQQSTIPHLGTFFPLWLGIATPEQAAAVRRNLSLFEREHGVSQTAEYKGQPAYQWVYPNGWPPSHWATVAGLERYGFREDALRIAHKYCSSHARLFYETDQLWEKIDVATGQRGGGEYEADPMLGWTAGVFIALHEYLSRYL